MHSLAVFLLAIILALPFVPAPQTQEQSPPQKKAGFGTVIPPGQFQFELARRQANAATVVNPPTEAPYYLPMTIHLVHRSDGTGGLTLDRLEVAMRDLNRMFEQAGMQFFIQGEIDHINDDNHFSIPTETVNWDALRQVNVVPNTINVYFTDLDGSGISGSTAPNGAIQGVLMDIDLAGTVADPSTFAHAIGRYFDLLVTDFPVPSECPSGNNCSSAGDRLCDTPADPGLRGRVDANCVYDGSATFIPRGCDMTPYNNPPVRNLMSESRLTCRSEFTPMQISKMLQTLRNANNRKNLITSGARYVDPLASASNANCTYDAPCRAVTQALLVALPGDFIFLKPGSYRASNLGDKQVTLNRWGNAGVAELVP